MSRGATSEPLSVLQSVLPASCRAPGPFARALRRPVGLRGQPAGPRVHRVRYARVQVHHGLPRRVAPGSAQRWQAAQFVVARSEQASAPVLLRPAAVARFSMETAARRRLAARETSGLLEASQVRLAARLEALRVTVVSPALAARLSAGQAVLQQAAAPPFSAVLHEAERAAPARREGLDDSARRSVTDLSAFARPRSVRPARKPARVGPARIARVTAAASTTRQ
ncbi:MAG: hypothetical protein BGO16_06320 [Nitrobacter sp. 62-23]|nr:MAG: hypothetical protein BGO16_06320 [Nitrobacter sp. 62-23]